MGVWYASNMSGLVLMVHEVANVVLKGINVTAYTPNISGIVFRNVSSISVQSTTVYSSSSITCAYGILVVQAESLQVKNIGLSKRNSGVFPHKPQARLPSNWFAL